MIVLQIRSQRACLDVEMDSIEHCDLYYGSAFWNRECGFWHSMARDSLNAVIKELFRQCPVLMKHLAEKGAIHDPRD